MAQTLDMTFKQYQAKCEREVQRERRDMASVETQAQDIRVNNLWHARNLDLLQQCVEYARHDQVRELLTLWKTFCAEESMRLGDRCNIMQRWHIEQLPHVYEQQERALFTEMCEIFTAKRVQPSVEQPVDVVVGEQSKQLALW
jgi:hypothetical protein